VTEDDLKRAEELLDDPDAEDCERFASWFGSSLIAEVRQAAAALAKLQAERDEAQAALEVCRESLVDQAAARADPAMPLLVASVRERLEGESEAVYAMSESREDRIYAHGLSLLCDWQKAAASRALGGGE